MSSKSWLPTSKGTELFPDVTKVPAVLRIKDVKPGTELYTAVANEYAGRLKQFHAKAQQSHALSVNQISKVRQQFGDDARVMYTNIYGIETIYLEVSRSKIEGYLAMTEPRPERDIEMRGYIAVHNANTSNSTPETNSENQAEWGLTVNNVNLGAHHLGDGECTVYTFGGYKLNYPSWNGANNPNGEVGAPAPKYPGDEGLSKCWYPMYGMGSDISPYGDPPEFDYAYNIANGFRFPGAASNVNIVDCDISCLNLLGDNDVQVYEIFPDHNAFHNFYGWIYAEFFGRYAREVEVSWRFPFAKYSNGVPRKILTNDDPLFWFSEIGGLPIPDPDTGLYDIGSINLDLSAPLTSGGSIINMRDIFPSIRSTIMNNGVDAPDGYPIGLHDPWP